MARLPLPDILQRGITYSLAGLTVYGLFVGVAVHRDTLRRGRGEFWSLREFLRGSDESCPPRNA